MGRKKKNAARFTNVIIIDASDSMSSKISAVQDGLKELFKDIKDKAKADKDVIFKTIVVDFSGRDDIRVLVNDTDTKLLTKSLADSYTTRSTTALYDAIGYAFSLVDAGEKNVFVNILTDGQENASYKFTKEAITSLIAESRKAGWGITFMGVSEDAINSAVSLGISRGNTVLYANTAKGVSGSSAIRTAMSTAYYGAGRFGYSLDLDNIAATVTGDGTTPDDDEK